MQWWYTNKNNNARTRTADQALELGLLTVICRTLRLYACPLINFLRNFRGGGRPTQNPPFLVNSIYERVHAMPLAPAALITLHQQQIFEAYEETHRECFPSAYLALLRPHTLIPSLTQEFPKRRVTSNSIYAQPFTLKNKLYSVHTFNIINFSESGSPVNYNTREKVGLSYMQVLILHNFVLRER